MLQIQFHSKSFVIRQKALTEIKILELFQMLH